MRKVETCKVQSPHQKHHCGLLVKSSGHTDALALPTRQNDTLLRVNTHITRNTNLRVNAKCMKVKSDSRNKKSKNKTNKKKIDKNGWRQREMHRQKHYIIIELSWYDWLRELPMLWCPQRCACVCVVDAQTELWRGWGCVCVRACVCVWLMHKES